MTDLARLPRYEPLPRPGWVTWGATIDGHRLRTRTGPWRTDHFSLGCECGWAARMYNGDPARFRWKPNGKPSHRQVQRWFDHLTDEGVNL